MRLTALTLAIAFAFIANASLAKDGIYEGKAQGRNGEVTVEVTIKGDKIENVQVKDWSETHPIADLPKVEIPKEIVEYQSTNVNAISGASMTSLAIEAAVKDALVQAGLNPRDFNTKVPQPPLQSGLVEEETGLVVVGAGGAGLSAAVAAAQKGVPVVVIEKAHFAGGNTSVSGGCYNAADQEKEAKQLLSEPRRKMIDDLLKEEVRNELHAKLIAKVKEQIAAYDKAASKYLFDSPELHALQTWKAGDYQGNLALVYRLTQESPVMQQELASMGFKWKPETTQVVGALWPRSNQASNYKAGVGFIDTFLDEIAIKQLPVTLLLSTSVKDLIVKDGRVVGVSAKGDNGLDYNVYGKDGVVLATGGFAANVEMRQQLDQLWNKTLTKDVMTTNLPGMQGDGIKMAQKVGADMIDLGYIQLLPTTDPYTGSTTTAVTSSTGMYVNKNGKRFVNELGRRDELSKAALAQPDHQFFIIGTSAHTSLDKDNRNNYGIKVDELIKQKKVFKGDTWDELAENAGINKENLKESVAKWNEFCKTLKDDEFGRPGCDPEHRLDGNPPYYATIMTPSVHHTMGGVRINENAQVLNKEGQPIPGLYAAGEVAGGVHGTNRVGCNAVPDALVYGRIAGLTAAGK